MSYPMAGYPMAALPNSDRHSSGFTARLTGEAAGIATSAAIAIEAP